MKIEIKSADLLEKEEREKIEYFFENNDNSYFKQSLNYSENKNKYICIVKSNEITAALIIFLERTFIGNILKQIGGPIFKKNISNKEELIENIYKEILNFAKKKKAFLIHISPNLENEKNIFTDEILKLGFMEYTPKNIIKDRIDMPYYFLINLKENTLKDLKENLAVKTRYNIRIAKEKKIKVLRDENIFKGVKEDKILSKIEILKYGNTIYLLNIEEYEDVLDFEYGKYITIWEIISTFKNENVENFNLLGFPGLRTKDTNIPPYSLYRFKKSFGAKLIEKLPEYIFVINEFKYNIYKCFFKREKNINEK